ncbi:MAG: FAD:protein FMN transferase [Desulfotignum sp.]|nr:FAD:protein FMN transferase [Desulfotignum sp.]
MKPGHMGRVLCLLCIIFLCFTGTAQGREYTIQGKTMGTFYTVKLVSARKQSIALWEKKIDTRLRQVNAGLSMYDPDSDISRFNQIDAGQPFRLSRDFGQVMAVAETVFRLSGGAWDGTVKPLVDLWGFGTKQSSNTLPDPAAIADALSCTGFEHLILENNHLLKKKPGITLDLGSIAKGYGVDAIARLLALSKIDNFLVEIGGELFGSGVNRHKKPWSVGITDPAGIASDSGLYTIITLDNKAIATSGDYRNFLEIQGKTYSHIIDPKTGFPVNNQVVSASVIAGTCTFADGLATALMVMDPADGLALVNRLEDTACLIIQKTESGFKEMRSQNFHTFVQP